MSRNPSGNVAGSKRTRLAKNTRTITSARRTLPQASNQESRIERSNHFSGPTRPVRNLELPVHTDATDQQLFSRPLSPIHSSANRGVFHDLRTSRTNQRRDRSCNSPLPNVNYVSSELPLAAQPRSQFAPMINQAFRSSQPQRPSSSNVARRVTSSSQPQRTSSSNVARSETRGWYDMVREAEESPSSRIQSEQDELAPPSYGENRWTSMFDEPFPGTLQENSTPVVSRKRNRLALEEYSPSNRKAKNSALNRQIQSVTKRLAYIAEVHQDTQFFFYVRTSTKQNMVMVSKGLEGIDKSRTMHTFHGLIDDFDRNPRKVPPISINERFPSTGLPDATCHGAFTWFKKTQSIKSMKVFYGKLLNSKLVGKRTGHAVEGQRLNVEWYLAALEPFFASDSTVTARKLWNCCDNLQYNGGSGKGRQYKELTRKHYLGLMQSLDLLAAARSEEPLPRDVDFVGNKLGGIGTQSNDDSTVVAAIDESNETHREDVVQTEAIQEPV